MATWTKDNGVIRNDAMKLVDFLKVNYSQFRPIPIFDSSNKLIKLDMQNMQDDKLEAIIADLQIRFPEAFE